MHILILCEAYPSAAQPYAMGFVHARARHYLAAGHEVEVLSFAAANGYAHEGVRVRAEAELEDATPFDIVHSHAPNLRNHLRWLRRHGGGVPLLWFIHGHELLTTRRYYPRPYRFRRNFRERIGFALQALYDPLKLLALRRFCRSLAQQDSRFGFVFVSEWMHREAVACNPWLADAGHLDCSRVIPNSVHPIFLQRRYRPTAEPLADVVCIRPFDNPKYAIDALVGWAVQAPHLSFHVYGTGRYFDHHPPPPNLTVFQRFIEQKDIPDLLDRYRVAALPTRLDSQGVMACEMATYGIPLLTSDIDVPRQMLKGFGNVCFVGSPAAAARCLAQLPPPLAADAAVRSRFDGTRLAELEIEFSKSLLIPVNRRSG